MQLVITEKPSVAKTLAQTIGAAGRHKGYYEGNGYVVSWCLGHLVELAMPAEYNPRYARWQKEALPIIPYQWKYHISEKTAVQFRILKEQMERNDVDSIICATDAGREGELIFRLVYEMAGCRKGVKRLWISSLEEEVIREGFRNLKPSTEYDPLYEAALCRERADWLVGINATRLYSCLHGQTMNVGRVVTPILQMVVKREQEIAAFTAEAFYGRECSDYDDFFRRTSYEPPAGVIDRYGKMVRYDDGVVVRYLERVDVYPDRIVVRFKAGVEVRVERRK